MMSDITTAGLFTPLEIRGLRLRNRIAVSPMCQYSSHDGFANDWHLVHLGSRAVGGAGLVMTEATAVSPEGRISREDLGIWSDEHVPVLARICAFVHSQGAAAGIQLAHAGRKAGTHRPWEGGAPLTDAEGRWPILGPSPLPFTESHAVPAAMTLADISTVIEQFTSATRRALAAGFDLIEIHAAHGYLFHSFLSPLSNHRTDKYGGSQENRARLLVEAADAVRGVIPQAMPLFVRISASDWVDGGWTIDDSIVLARQLAPRGVDLIDCSSGGAAPGARIPMSAGYQVPFAERIRREGEVLCAAVGLITEPAQADSIIRSGQADLVMLARALLRDPYWPLHAAKQLGQQIDCPPQYARARD